MSQIQLITVGFPGCGKTTLLKKIVSHYQNKSVVHVERDDLLSDSIYFKKCKEVSTTSPNDNTIVCFDKCHHSEKVRSLLLSNIKVQRVIWLNFYHPVENKVENMIRVCIDRIKLRKEHKVLKFSSAIHMIMGSIKKHYQPLDLNDESKLFHTIEYHDGSYHKDEIININVLWSEDDMFEKVISVIDDLI